MCSFSAGRKAGNPVAVVLDPAVQYTVPVMAKIAERCVEPLVVVVQPGKKGSRYLLRLNILTPGGGAAKTMAETATIAVLQVLNIHGFELHRALKASPGARAAPMAPYA